MYSLNALSVHLELVMFDRLSNSVLESASLPGRTNGLEGPFASAGSSTALFFAELRSLTLL